METKCLPVDSLKDYMRSIFWHTEEIKDTITKDDRVKTHPNSSVKNTKIKQFKPIYQSILANIDVIVTRLQQQVKDGQDEAKRIRWTCESVAGERDKVKRAYDDCQRDKDYYKSKTKDLISAKQGLDKIVQNLEALRKLHVDELSKASQANRNLAEKNIYLQKQYDLLQEENQKEDDEKKFRLRRDLQHSLIEEERLKSNTADEVDLSLSKKLRTNLLRSAPRNEQGEERLTTQLNELRVKFSSLEHVNAVYLEDRNKVNLERENLQKQCRDLEEQLRCAMNDLYEYKNPQRQLTYENLLRTHDDTKQQLREKETALKGMHQKNLDVQKENEELLRRSAELQSVRIGLYQYKEKEAVQKQLQDNEEKENELAKIEQRDAKLLAQESALADKLEVLNERLRVLEEKEDTIRNREAKILDEDTTVKAEVKKLRECESALQRREEDFREAACELTELRQREQTLQAEIQNIKSKTEERENAVKTELDAKLLVEKNVLADKLEEHNERLRVLQEKEDYIHKREAKILDAETTFKAELKKLREGEIALEQKEEILQHREVELREEENRVTCEWAKLQEREESLQEEIQNSKSKMEGRENAVKTEFERRENVLADKLEEHNERLRIFQENEDSIHKREAKILDEETTFKAELKKLRQGEIALEQKEEIMRRREVELREGENGVICELAKLREREESQQEEIQNIRSKMEERENAFEQRDSKLLVEENVLADKSEELNDRLRVLQEKEDSIHNREAKILDGETTFKAELKKLRECETALKQKEEILQRREAQFGEEENKFSNDLAKLRERETALLEEAENIRSKVASFKEKENTIKDEIINLNEHVLNLENENFVLLREKEEIGKFKDKIDLDYQNSLKQVVEAQEELKRCKETMNNMKQVFEEKEKFFLQKVSTWEEGNLRISLSNLEEELKKKEDILRGQELIIKGMREDFESKNTSMQEDALNVELQIGTLLQDRKDNSEEIAELHESHNCLKNQIEDIKEQLNESEKLLKEKREEFDKNENALRGEISILKQRKEILDVAAKNCQRFENDLEKLYKDLSVTFEEETEHPLKKLAEFARNATALQSETTILKNSNQSLLQEKEELLLQNEHDLLNELKETKSVLLARNENLLAEREEYFKAKEDLFKKCEVTSFEEIKKRLAESNELHQELQNLYDETQRLLKDKDRSLVRKEEEFTETKSCLQNEIFVLTRNLNVATKDMEKVKEDFEKQIDFMETEKSLLREKEELYHQNEDDLLKQLNELKENLLAEREEYFKAKEILFKSCEVTSFEEIGKRFAEKTRLLQDLESERQSSHEEAQRLLQEKDRSLVKIEEESAETQSCLQNEIFVLNHNLNVASRDMDKVKESFEKQIEFMERENDLRKEENNRLREECQVVKNELQNIEKQLIEKEDVYRKKENEAMNEVSTLTGKMEELQVELKNVLERSRQQEDEIRVIKLTHENLSKSLALKEEAEEASMIREATLKQKLFDVSANQQKQKEEIDQDMHQVILHFDRIDLVLQNKEVEFKSRVEVLQKEIEKCKILHHDNGRLLEDLKELYQNRISDLQLHVDNVLIEKGSLFQKCRELEEELRSNRPLAYEQLHEFWKKAEGKCKELEETLKTAEQKIAILKINNEGTSNNIILIRQEVDELSRQNRRLEQELTNINESPIYEEFLQMQKEVAKRRIKEEEYKTNEKNLLIEFNKLEEELRSNRTLSYERLYEFWKKAEGKCKELEETLKTAEQKIAILKINNESTSNDIMLIRQERDELSRQNRRLEQEVTNMNESPIYEEFLEMQQEVTKRRNKEEEYKINEKNLIIEFNKLELENHVLKTSTVCKEIAKMFASITSLEDIASKQDTDDVKKIHADLKNETVQRYGRRMRDLQMAILKKIGHLNDDDVRKQNDEFNRSVKTKQLEIHQIESVFSLPTTIKKIKSDFEDGINEVLSDTQTKLQCCHRIFSDDGCVSYDAIVADVTARNEEVVSMLAKELRRLQEIDNFLRKAAARTVQKNVDETDEPYVRDALMKIEEINRNTRELEVRVAKFRGTKEGKTYLDLNHKLLGNVMKLDVLQANGHEKIRKEKREAIKFADECMDRLEANLI